MKYLNKDDRDSIVFNNIKTDEWLKYFKSLWTSDTLEDEVEIEIGTNMPTMDIDLIEFEEMESILNSFHNNKTPGNDGLNMELFKYAPLEIKHRLLHIINLCWTTFQIPDEWKEAVVTPIFKKGDRWNCNNYRGISILNAAYKVYAKIICRRLNTISEYKLREEQCGFRKGRSCSDCVYVAQQIIQKRREFNLPTYMMFVDYEKAFDRVKRDKLWEIMYDKCYPIHLIRVIQSMYNNTEILINNITETSTKAKVNQGVKQGCPLSPALFNLYIDAAIEEWQRNLKIGLKINNLFINTMLFADDQIIFAMSESDLQRSVYKLQTCMINYNLKISNRKTKTMAFLGPDHLRCKIVINKEIIEQVSSFKYLGCTITYLKEQDVDIKINRFQGMCGTIIRTLKNKTLPETQLKFYKTLAVPLLTYGCENWTLNRNNKRKLESSEMKFLRSVAGLTLLDKQKNVDIRNRLQIYNLYERVQAQKQNWYEHIERMEHYRLPKILLNYKPTGRRSVGRPRTRWIDDIIL